MGLSGRFAGLWESWRPSHALLAIPVVLIIVITVVDIFVPEDVHLGPLLVIAPAITASFAGPLLTGVIGLLAVAAQAYIGLQLGVLSSRNWVVQIAALAGLSALIVFFCVVRERRRRELAQVRSVAEAAQHVLLWPLPDRIGPLRIACLYLAAEDEAQIGGDLYATTRIEGGTRVLIGDVRGKGLAAIGEAALLLGAFREAAHQHSGLPALAAALEQSVSPSTRSRNGPPGGPRAPRRHSCATCEATSSPMPADIWATTQPSSRSTAIPSPIREAPTEISHPDGFRGGALLLLFTLLGPELPRLSIPHSEWSGPVVP